MVRSFYTPTDKRLPAELARISKSIRDIQRPTGTEKNRSLLLQQEAIITLQDQQAQLIDQQDRLEDIAQVYVASTGNSHGSHTSWFPNPPSVSATSLSRKFRITITGGSVGGTTFLTFSAPGYSRERALGASASAILARTSALGGLSNAGTAQRSWTVTMPGKGPYTFTAQARPHDQYVTAQGLQIEVQPAL